MKRLFTILFLTTLLSTICFAQVKSSYLYNTSMPYGTLDIRTKISSTNYYYLQEGQTFSYRESAPGVRTNSYNDMTTWDSSPYQQGHLRQKNGATDKFIMNYRLLLPANYNAAYAEGYPLIVILHGAGERANCLYNTCYHATPSYDPNVNSPAAPNTVNHSLLNNDQNVNIGGKQHLDARNLAGTRLPNDPALPAKAFSGFVLAPQMLNVWDSLNVQDVIRIVQLHCTKYKIDPNRIYIHGLSIGGYAVYEAIKRAPWLFAAALPMSAVREAANIFKHNQQGKVVHIPLWVFQGGTDKNPTQAFTESVNAKFINAGAIVRYSLYPTQGHAIWNKAYGEVDFFPWMKSKNKSNIHPYKGITAIIRNQSQYPKLMLAEGFLAYQWEKDGVVISTAKSNTYTANTPGTYRARFSRVSYTPTSEAQWNKWSAPITITETTSTAQSDPESIEMENSLEEVKFSMHIYPNPSRSENINIQLQTNVDAPVELELIDYLGRKLHQRMVEAYELNDEIRVTPSSGLTNGVYIIRARQGKMQLKSKLIVRN